MKKKAKSKKIYYLGASIFLLMFSFLFYIWPRIMIVNLSDQMKKIKVQNNTLLHENDLLRIEFEKIKSLEKIEEKAIKKGFSFPEQGQIVYIKSGMGQ